MAAIGSVDIFCRVVDNLGDAGVCWRLARQMHQEHQLRVRLWIDQPDTLAHFVLANSTDALLLAQMVRQWTQDSDFSAPFVPADLALETFGCDLPERYAIALAERDPPGRWVNLEYLSAEPWVDTCHGLPSPHPRLSLLRSFFFPGFSLASGGLLREADLLATRLRAQAAYAADPGGQGAVLQVSLFCYADAPVAALLDAFEAGPTAVRCVIFQGPAQEAARAWLRSRVPARTELVFHPWLTQAEFDHVLWSSAINFVRGEDSFVRAQWAGRPLVWDCYVQAEAAHHVKVDAFLRRYTAYLDASAISALTELWHAWIGRNAAGLAGAWRAAVGIMPVLTRHAERWCEAQARAPDLVTALLRHAARTDV